MKGLSLLLALALAGCAAAPMSAPPTSQAEDDASMDSLLHLGSAACLNGVAVGCRFVQAHDYCVMSDYQSTEACAEALTYGRMMLTAAALASR